MTTIGLIVPPADGAVPPEPLALYPDLHFIARGLALPELTPEGYDAVIDHVADLAIELKSAGAGAIALMGTSLSFYRGVSGNAMVREAMHAATGLPVTTMTDAVIEGLQAVGARRLAVATAYTETVNDRLRTYFESSGFEILSLNALSLTDVKSIQSVGPDDLIALGRHAMDQAPDADALFISCGGLRTLPVIVPLENAVQRPVISSATAGAWAAARLVGHSGRARGAGDLFSR